MARTVIYSNVISHGPSGTEYLLPIEPSRLKELLPQSELLDSDRHFSILRDSWNTTDASASVIARALSTFTPRSFYHLPVNGVNQNWFLMDRLRFVLFVPSGSTALSLQLPEPIELVMRLFGGYRFGYNPHPDDNFLLPDSGFVPCSDLKLITENDESYTWHDDESVIGGVFFFSTDCGGRFYCRADGSIVKWNMGNATIADAFTDCLSFAKEFENYYTSDQPVKDSQFYG